MTDQAQPPDSGSTGGWLPPVPAGHGPAPPAAPQATAPPPPPAWGAQPPWQSTLYYTYREPGNDAGVAGFCLSIGAIALLVFSFGLAAVITLPLAIAGTLLSVRGRRRVKRGETSQHGGLARVGFWLGLVAVLVSIGAIVGWILAITNGHVFDRTSPEPRHQIPAVVRGR